MTFFLTFADFENVGSLEMGPKAKNEYQLHFRQIFVGVSKFLQNENNI